RGTSTGPPDCNDYQAESGVRHERDGSARHWRAVLRTASPGCGYWPRRWDGPGGAKRLAVGEGAHPGRTGETGEEIKGICARKRKAARSRTGLPEEGTPTRRLNAEGAMI